MLTRDQGTIFLGGPPLVKAASTQKTPAVINGVVEVLVKVGDQVGVDQPLARLRAPGGENATEGEPA